MSTMISIPLYKGRKEYRGRPRCVQLGNVVSSYLEEDHILCGQLLYLLCGQFLLCIEVDHNVSSCSMQKKATEETTSIQVVRQFIQNGNHLVPHLPNVTLICSMYRGTFSLSKPLWSSRHCEAGGVPMMAIYI